jgi:hypothetical protein
MKILNEIGQPFLDGSRRYLIFFQGIIRNQIIYMIMAIIGSIPTLHHFLFTPTRTLPHQGGGDI